MMSRKHSTNFEKDTLTQTRDEILSSTSKVELLTRQSNNRMTSWPTYKQPIYQMKPTQLLLLLVVIRAWPESKEHCYFGRP